MSYCKPCAVNGRRREGGDLGICHVHVKRKCVVCDTPSMGHELCSSCAHKEDILRMNVRSSFKIWNPEDHIIDDEIRKEKLQAAKFKAHESVEMFFRAMHEACQAIWGHPTPPEIDDEQEAA